MPKIFLLSFFIFTTSILSSPNMKIEWAKIQSANTFQCKVKGELARMQVSRWGIEPKDKITSITLSADTLTFVVETPLRLNTHYYLLDPTGKKHFLLPDGILDSLFSNQPLGYSIENKGITLRVFSPRAKWVKTVLFNKFDDQCGEEYRMRPGRDGTWQLRIDNSWLNKYYGYKIWGPTGEGEMFDSTIVIADPYSPAVVTKNHYTHPGKTLILPPDEFDWENDRPLNIPLRNLIIYEMHVRDLTAHPSSGIDRELRGTYSGLIKEGGRGGIDYISKLGVNAIELLPVQDFGNIEVPYKNKSTPVYNTWNPYAQNHWGYMTSYFFAPEPYYSSGGNLTSGKFNGKFGNQVKEFKEVVKAFHRRGMAVLMDVVYNHVSQYDYNPLKYIDKFYYFRLNNDCSFTSQSGCGNDLNTTRPMVRRLILDSVAHWMQEYHVDGFRFDLAHLIDWETCDLISRRAKELNPAVILIAEPWGGGYDPAIFSDHGWASWNDQIRNGVKGQNPFNGLGYIFGKWQGNNTIKSIRRYLLGSLRQFGGQYRKISHSVNYLESHDDRTLGDFIRLGLGDVTERERILDPGQIAKLSENQLKLNKLAALFLFTSQGPLMIHEGQEFARSKVIATTSAPDTNQGRIDHNSYNKDNPTNWLNFDYADLNADLISYYRELISMRKKFPAFRQAEPKNIKFLKTSTPLFLVFTISYSSEEFLVLLNVDPNSDYSFGLQEKNWRILVDTEHAFPEHRNVVTSLKLKVPSHTGLVLQKMKIK